MHNLNYTQASNNIKYYIIMTESAHYDNYYWYKSTSLLSSISFSDQLCYSLTSLFQVLHQRESGRMPVGKSANLPCQVCHSLISYLLLTYQPLPGAPLVGARSVQKTVCKENKKSSVRGSKRMPVGKLDKMSFYVYQILVYTLIGQVRQSLSNLDHY